MTHRLSTLGPFFAGGVAAFATLPFGARESSVDRLEVLAAALLFGGVAVAAALVPWERLPRALGAVPLGAAFAVVALLRDAEGGGPSGYGPLVLLPVFWLALHGSRREMFASFFAVAAVFVVPILVDPSHYPTAEWRRALLWLIVTPIVGVTTHGLVERVRESARVDPLTGLPNRRAWEERLPLALTLGRRSGLPVSVALLDLDGFKAYNDTHGHVAGDRLLVRAAAAWLAEVRTVDLLSRVGGDEFALLLPDASEEEAATVVARVTASTPDIACSAGVAEWDRQESVERLLTRADGLLYADKAHGGGR